MAETVVLVNGLPGSGKTTVATALAEELEACLMSKDQIKESLALVLAERAPASLGAIAMDTIWALARDVESTVIVESFWFEPRDRSHALEGITRSRATRAMEVWCDLPVGIARARYAARTRNPVHQDAHRLTSDWDRWAEQATPLGIVPVLRGDTERPLRMSAFSERVRAALR